MGLTHRPPIKIINNEKTVPVYPIGSGNPFTPPIDSDAITVEYPSNTVEIYRYRQGGVSGTILKTVTVTYLTSNKKDLSSVVIA